MRIPPALRTLCKLAAFTLIVVIAGFSARSTSRGLTQRDKAYYADQNTINFVRPGLVLKVTAGKIASDGTISTTFTITDKAGLPLDRLGITTPGAVSVSCMAAYIPQGQTQYVSYTTRVQNSTITGKSANQASTDSGGTFATVADGTYTYTFKTKAPTSFDQTVTHTIGCQASRSLTDFNLGTNYATSLFNFVPNGSAVKTTRDVIANSSCNKCHDDLAFHGGSRRGIGYCVMCHTPQTVDPDTGNTVDMKVFIHKLHMGQDLPSVKAGTPYQIIGYQNAVSDWSTVAFPTAYTSGVPGVADCQVCHEQTTGAAQAKAYMTNPSRDSCGSCHDNIDFASGKNHVNLPQTTDANCSTCHKAVDGEYDASITGAHTIPEKSSFNPGINFAILKVDNGSAGKAPTVTFTVKDNAGAPIPMSTLKTSPGRLALVLAGPTTDYGYTNFGSDVTTGGYVSEDATGSTCDSTGTCTYTFTHKIPADAKGTFSVGMEGRRGYTVMPGTTKEMKNLEIGGHNVVFNFSVDGSKVAPRRTVVDIAKCNQCHTRLALHGENRDRIEQCVLCHNPSETDKARRPSATNPADKAAPPQSVEFAFMIHRIHTGENLVSQNAGYTVVGYGGSHNDFSEVRYPAMGPTGEVGVTNNCSMCHVNSSEQTLPTGKLDVTQPQGPITTMGSVTAACTGCHATKAVASHALANTTTLGESCDACHSTTSDFSVSRVHAN